MQASCVRLRRQCSHVNRLEAAQGVAVNSLSRLAPLFWGLRPIRKGEASDPHSFKWIPLIGQFCCLEEPETHVHVHANRIRETPMFSESLHLCEHLGLNRKRCLLSGRVESMAFIPECNLRCYLRYLRRCTSGKWKLSLDGPSGSLHEKCLGHSLVRREFAPFNGTGSLSGSIL